MNMFYLRLTTFRYFWLSIYQKLNGMLCENFPLLSLLVMFI